MASGLLGLGVAAAVAAAAPQAGAATVCTEFLPAVEARVYTPFDLGGAAPTGMAACEIADSIDNDSVAGVNAIEGFFAAAGALPWAFRERVNFTDGGTGAIQREAGPGGKIGLLADVPFPDPNLDPVVGSGEGGVKEHWSVSPKALAPGEELMLLFKSGTKAAPAAVIAYLIAPGVFSGSYSSPFTGSKGQVMAISHVSAYTRLTITPENFEIPPPQEVPLPGTLALLLGALGGLAAAGARRRR